MFDVRSMLCELVRLGGSDLHLKVGSPPLFRVDGVLRHSDLPPLDARETEHALHDLLTDQAKLHEFAEEHEVDFAFELEGVSVPGDAHVNYSSWASHHLPHVFPEPHRFIPERFTAQAKAALPKGAYVPFGGGSRTCIGMRFGQLEVRTLATEIVRHLSFELQPSFQLSIRQMPTISPKQGLPMIVSAR